MLIFTYDIQTRNFIREGKVHKNQGFTVQITPFSEIFIFYYFFLWSRTFKLDLPVLSHSDAANIQRHTNRHWRSLSSPACAAHGADARIFKLIQMLMDHSNASMETFWTTNLFLYLIQWFYCFTLFLWELLYTHREVWRVPIHPSSSLPHCGHLTSPRCIWQN